MTRVRAALLAPLFASLLAAPVARAQSKPPADSGSDNRAVAEMLFFTARGLMEAGRYPEACAKLAESYRLDAAAGTLLNLAVCHEKEGKIASAWGEFRQAIADARRAGRQDREELAKERIAAIEPELPLLTIDVPPAARVPGLVVLRNDVPMHEATWATELPVDPGAVRVTARAPGYLPRTTTITIERKQHATVSLAPLDPAPVVRAPPEYWTARRRLGLTLMSGGVAALGAGAAFGVATLDQRSKSDDNCPLFDGERRCTQVGVDEMSRAKGYAIVSDVALGVGAAALVTGGILFLTGGSSAERGAPASERHARAPWSWRVGFGPGGAQGSVTRSF